MPSRAINIACATAMMARHSVLVMFFYMRLEKHVCVAMSRGRLIHVYCELLLVRSRIRTTYTADNGNHQSKERFIHESFDLLHCQLRCVACPVVPCIFLARELRCREPSRW